MCPKWFKYVSKTVKSADKIQILKGLVPFYIVKALGH